MYFITKKKQWYLNTSTPVVVHGQGFSCTLSLIVATSDTCHFLISQISFFNKSIFFMVPANY